MGLNYVYLVFEVGNDLLEDVIKGLRVLNVKGFNVFMFNKIKIFLFFDELVDSVKFLGVVNIVVNDNGVLVGYSIDGMGYIWNLKEYGVDIIGKKMMLIGLGGVVMFIVI